MPPKRRSRRIRSKENSAYRPPIDILFLSDDSDIEQTTSRVQSTRKKQKSVPSTITISDDESKISNKQPIIRQTSDRSSRENNKNNENKRVISDSDDSDIAVPVSENYYCDSFDGTRCSEPFDSDIEDLYSVNYQDEQCKVNEEVKKIEMSRPAEKKKTRNTSIESFNIESASPILCDESVFNSTSKSVEVSDDESFNVSDVECNIKIRKPRRSAQTKSALAKMQLFLNREKECKSLDTSLIDIDDNDILLLSDNEDKKAICRIRWGTKYLKLEMRKNGKFLELYKKLADENKVSISQIILSFKDEIVSPESRPSDIGFTIADILEGGVLKTDKAKDDVGKDENCITLKFQDSSNRKGPVTVSINKYDVLLVAAKKYSELKSIDISKLRFKFDGETLDLSETPDTYDLEGDECIDVYIS